MNYRIQEKAPFSVIEKVEIHSTENAENLKSIPKFWERSGADGTLECLNELANDKTYIFGICYANPVKNARLGIFESAIMLSQSSLEIFPFLYRVTALLHDEVYPPKSPRK